MIGINENDEMGKIDLVLKALYKNPIIAMVVVPSKEIAIKLAKALIKGGVKWLELTFRNEICEESLKELNKAKLNIRYGAGTVRTIEQVQAAYDAGAEFLVSPGFNESVVSYAKQIGIPFFPGVDSTLGIEKAQNLGLKVLKIFPASLIGGPKWCRAMAGPYSDVRFIPSGGINLENLGEYLQQPNVIAVGGSFLAPKKLLQAENYEKITEIAQKATDIVRALRE
jgi:2-dehydro-3-deoxyphosphogluconate aldolase / (4S)-4-hydroxy-2-oxoglutarate aldolase